jgi:hypothetical protein
VKNPEPHATAAKVATPFLKKVKFLPLLGGLSVKNPEPHATVAKVATPFLKKLNSFHSLADLA